MLVLYFPHQNSHSPPTSGQERVVEQIIALICPIVALPCAALATARSQETPPVRIEVLKDLTGTTCRVRAVCTGHYRAGQALMKLGRFHEAVDSYELASQAFLTAGQEEEGSAQALEEALRDAKDAAALADAVQDAQKDLIGAAQVLAAPPIQARSIARDRLDAWRPHLHLLL